PTLRVSRTVSVLYPHWRSCPCQCRAKEHAGTLTVRSVARAVLSQPVAILLRRDTYAVDNLPRFDRALDAWGRQLVYAGRLYSRAARARCHRVAGSADSGSASRLKQRQLSQAGERRSAWKIR